MMTIEKKRFVDNYSQHDSFECHVGFLLFQNQPTSTAVPREREKFSLCTKKATKNRRSISENNKMAIILQ